jgi:hypothetical protein
MEISDDTYRFVRDTVKEALAHERLLVEKSEAAVAVAVAEAKRNVDAHFLVSNGHMAEILSNREHFATAESADNMKKDIEALKLADAARSARTAQLVAMSGIAQVLLNVGVGFVIYLITRH